MDAYIYKSMKRYRLKYLVILIVLMILWGVYFHANSPYILNRFTDYPTLSEAHFSQNTKTVKVGKPFELHRNDKREIRDFAVKDESYWMDDKYEFKVPVSDMIRIESDITNSITGTGGKTTKQDISGKLWLTEIGDKKVVVLTYPDFDPEKDREVTGIFTSIPYIVKYELARSFGENPDFEVCEYMLDTRGLEMETEGFDTVFSFVTLLILIYLTVKLLMQFANYHKTPTYRQLEKYGDCDEVEKLIEKELTQSEYIDKQYVCENWIVIPDTFKLKIVRNHRKHGNFKYV